MANIMQCKYSKSPQSAEKPHQGDQPIQRRSARSSHLKITLAATLSPLTLWKSVLSLPLTTLWETPLVRRSARE